MHPTLKPTAKPTAKPTRQPTPKPTVNGETKQPTRSPLPCLDPSQCSCIDGDGFYLGACDTNALCTPYNIPSNCVAGETTSGPGGGCAHKLIGCASLFISHEFICSRFTFVCSDENECILPACCTHICTITFGQCCYTLWNATCDALVQSEVQCHTSVHITPSGSDLTGTGLRSAPVYTLQRGLERAAFYGVGRIHVAEGVYNYSSRQIFDGSTANSLTGGFTFAGAYRINSTEHVQWKQFPGVAVSRFQYDPPPIIAGVSAEIHCIGSSSGIAHLEPPCVNLFLFTNVTTVQNCTSSSLDCTVDVVNDTLMQFNCVREYACFPAGTFMCPTNFTDSFACSAIYCDLTQHSIDSVGDIVPPFPAICHELACVDVINGTLLSMMVANASVQTGGPKTCTTQQIENFVRSDLYYEAIMEMRHVAVPVIFDNLKWTYVNITSAPNERTNYYGLLIWNQSAPVNVVQCSMAMHVAKSGANGLNGSTDDAGWNAVSQLGAPWPNCDFGTNLQCNGGSGGSGGTSQPFAVNVVNGQNGYMPCDLNFSVTAFGGISSTLSSSIMAGTAGSNGANGASASASFSAGVFNPAYELVSRQFHYLGRSGRDGTNGNAGSHGQGGGGAGAAAIGGATPRTGDWGGGGGTGGCGGQRGTGGQRGYSTFGFYISGTSSAQLSIFSSEALAPPAATGGVGGSGGAGAPGGAGNLGGTAYLSDPLRRAPGRGGNGGTGSNGGRGEDGAPGRSICAAAVQPAYISLYSSFNCTGAVITVPTYSPTAAPSAMPTSSPTASPIACNQLAVDTCECRAANATNATDSCQFNALFVPELTVSGDAVCVPVSPQRGVLCFGSDSFVNRFPDQYLISRPERIVTADRPSITLNNTEVMSVAFGANFTAVLMTGSVVYVFGGDCEVRHTDFCTLGDLTVRTLNFSDFPLGESVTQIAATERALFMLYTNGSVRAMGTSMPSTSIYFSSLTVIANFFVTDLIRHMASNGRVLCLTYFSGSVLCSGSSVLDNVQNGTGLFGSNATGNSITRQTGSGAGALVFPQPAIKTCVGVAHACALLANFTVKCWGQCMSGQCGGDIKPFAAPIANASALNNIYAPYVASFRGQIIVDLWCGEYSTCFLLEPSRNAVCFGNVIRKPLDLSNPTPSFETVVLSNSTIIDFASISGGRGILAVPGAHQYTKYSNCVLLYNYALHCWGLNDKRQADTTGVRPAAFALPDPTKPLTPFCLHTLQAPFNKTTYPESLCPGNWNTRVPTESPTFAPTMVPPPTPFPTF